MKKKGGAGAVELLSDDDALLPQLKRKKPASQLKAGWALVPLALSSPAATSSSGSSSKQKGKGKGREAPAKAVSAAVKGRGKARSRSPVKVNGGKRAKIATGCAASRAAARTIEILSSDTEQDSDDDILEVQPEASTSRVKVEDRVKPATPKRELPMRAPSRPASPPSARRQRAASTVSLRAPSMVVDLSEDDDEELAVQVASRTIVKTRTVSISLDEAPELDEEGARERDDYSAFEDDVEDEYDNDDLSGFDDSWGDGERSLGMQRTISTEAEGQGESAIDVDSMQEGAPSWVESDDDILEIMDMDRQDSLGPPPSDNDVEDPATNKAGPSKRRAGNATPDKKGLLKPLSALRRSMSPAAMAAACNGGKANAFTALMHGENPDKKWSDAAESEKAMAKRGFARPAPFYKILDGMKIAVDAFKYGKIPGVEAYFLSHAHSDHYTNLSASWSNGPIYCSVGTANLIKYKLGVKDEWVKPQPNDVPFEVAGTRCTVLDANHCPGSSIFLFEGPHTSPNSPHYRAPGSSAKARQFRYLHCGDFRASPAHLLHPALKDKKLDICYLDTTYLNPKYCFPAQEQVIDACSELVRCRVLGDRDALKKGSGGGAQLVRQGEMMKGWLSKAKKEELLEEGLLDVTATSAIVKADPGIDTKPSLEDVKDEKPRERLLVMVGTYSIGKERIVKGIARAINAKVYCDKRKAEIFACQDDPELMSMLTDNPLEAQVHVTWLGQIKVDDLSDYLDRFKPHFTSIVGLRPTGWTFKPEGTLALTLKQPSVIQMLGRELQRNYNPSWMTPTKDSTKTVEAYGVPYSEHSSFAELTCFAVSMDCAKFIPTVNVGSKASRDKMQIWINKWQEERKRRRQNGDPLMIPHRTMQYW